MLLLQAVLTLVATVCAVEIALLLIARTSVVKRIRLSFGSLTYMRIVISSSEMDDDEKQKVMQKMTFDMLKSVVSIVAFFALIFVPFVVLWIVQTYATPTINYFGVFGLFAMTTIGIGYAFVRQRNG